MSRVVTLVSTGHLLILELVVVYKSQKKSIFVLEVEIFFTLFWKYWFWVINLNFIGMVALLRMKAGVPIVSEYYLPCIVIDVLFSHRSRLPRRRETSSLESELNSTQWGALYTVCSPASMAMAVFIPLCVAAIGSVLFVNWDRHCCIIMNRFVWFCIVSRL